MIHGLNGTPRPNRADPVNRANRADPVNRVNPVNRARANRVSGRNEPKLLAPHVARRAQPNEIKREAPVHGAPAPTRRVQVRRANPLADRRDREPANDLKRRQKVPVVHLVAVNVHRGVPQVHRRQEQASHEARRPYPMGNGLPAPGPRVGDDPMGHLANSGLVALHDRWDRRNRHVTRRPGSAPKVRRGPAANGRADGRRAIGGQA